MRRDRSHGAARAERVPWVQADADGVTLTLFIKPRASRNKIGEVKEDALVVSVAAPPVDGEANAELVRFVAKALGVPRSRVTLVAGEASRHKRVKVSGLSIAEVTAAFLA